MTHPVPAHWLVAQRVAGSFRPRVDGGMVSAATRGTSVWDAPLSVDVMSPRVWEVPPLLRDVL